MLNPTSKTFYELEYSQVAALLPYMIPGLDMYVFAREGHHYYKVDVTDEIFEVEEWKKELRENPNRCSVKEALSDYLSLACYNKAIPPGEYIVAIFW